MLKDLESSLTNSRASAEEAAKKLEETLKNCTKSGNKDAEKYQLKCGLYALRSICLVVNKQKLAHLDVYCDIVKRVLQPFLRPAINSLQWGQYLENLRYLYYTTIQNKRYKEAALIFESLAVQKDKLQEESHYKSVLTIYGMHLLAQRSYQQIEVKAAAKEINAALKALTELFTEMLRLNKEMNFVYPEIMVDFQQQLCKQYNFFSNLPTEKLQMYEAFFALLKGMKYPQTECNNVATQAQFHLEVLTIFMQIDTISKLQNPVALLYLQTCREIPLLQSEKVIGYAFTILYYFVRFIYAQCEVPNFTKSYTELCLKFVSFFEKSTVLLVREMWYMDYLVVLCVILLQVHHRANVFYGTFWQQIDNISCIAAHLDFLLATIKLASRITESKRAPWTCCKSVRKHVILSIAQCGLATYSNLVPKLTAQKHDGKQQQPQVKIMSNLHQTLGVILNQGLQAIETMSCIAGSEVTPLSAPTTSVDLKMFYAHFSQLVRDLTTPEESLYVLTLAEKFARIREKFTHNDWVCFMHRLNKNAALCGNLARMSEMHSHFVAALLQETSIDWTQLRSQVALYYTATERVPSGCETRQVQHCLLECWQQSNSALKPTLNAQQQHLLYWLETQHLFKYQKATETLQQSLLRCVKSSYDHVLIVRQAKMKPSASSSKLIPLCTELRAKNMQRNRLEHLTLAHACMLLFQEAKEAQQKLPDVDSKMCMEDNMEELLDRAEIQALKLDDEMLVVDLALEAWKGFQQFYALYDVNHISMDEAFIDWEVIMEDVLTVAQHLQYIGYTENALKVWLLLYQIAHTLSDHHNVLRALAFCCEHVEYFDANDVIGFQLTAAIDVHQPQILVALQQLTQLNKRQQSGLLVCLCQLAYYHAHAGHMHYSQMLLQLVQHLHSTLPDRSGKYDLVFSTWEAVRIRIMWKQLSADANGDVGLLQQCLLRMVEDTLEHFREFVFISSSDSLPYMILLFGLTQQMAECATNRLYDSNVSNLFVSVLRLALQSGNVLRVVQILTMWMWMNLQMEYVKKAEVKLRLIECLLGVKNVNDQHIVKTKQLHSVKKATRSLATEMVSEIFSLQLNLGLETMRKVVPPHVSPVRVEKLYISPNTRRRGLRHFLRSNSNESQPINEWLNWYHFAVGCLNARLYYLIEDYDQLDDFYKHCQRWLHVRRQDFNQRYFRNFQIVCMQHYINVLRARGKYELALEQIDFAQMKLVEMSGKVDTMYSVNLQLQRCTIQLELQRKCQPAQERVGRAQLRRALTFNTSFEERQHQQQSQRAKASVYTPANNAKTPQYKPKSMAFKIFSSDEDFLIMPPQTPMPATTSKHKKQRKEALPVTTVKQSTSPELQSECNHIDELNLCQAIELIDLANSSDEDVNEGKSKNTTKRKAAITPEPSLATATKPKTARKTPARKATTSKSTAVNTTSTTNVNTDPDFVVKEMYKFMASKPPRDQMRNAIDMALKMEPTESGIAALMSTISSKRGRKKAPLVKQKNISEDDDNNNVQRVESTDETPTEKPKPRQRKTPNPTASQITKAKQTSMDVAAVKTRRRAIATNRNENDENSELHPLSSVSSTTITSSTRRRQRT